MLTAAATMSAVKPHVPLRAVMAGRTTTAELHAFVRMLLIDALRGAARNDNGVTDIDEVPWFFPCISPVIWWYAPCLPASIDPWTCLAVMPAVRQAAHGQEGRCSLPTSALLLLFFGSLDFVVSPCAG